MLSIPLGCFVINIVHHSSPQPKAPDYTEQYNIGNRKEKEEIEPKKKFFGFNY